jgi:hypothetical protein
MADDKKKSHSKDEQEEAKSRSQQDSLYEDEGWEDADDNDEDESGGEDAEDDDESDDEPVDDDDDDESEDDDDDKSDENDDEPVDEDDEDEPEADEDDEDEPVDEDDDESEDDDDWLPDWAPWAVLVALILLGLAGGFGVLTPKATDDAATAADVPTTAASQEAEPTPEPQPQPRQVEQPKNQESISASHLLVAYKGALRANPQITRTKEEAKKRAEEALKKAKQPGAGFAKLVGEYSDEPGAEARGGKLGSFTRNRMVKPFSDAAFKLKVGEISDVVETRFGFHVIQRTQ